MPKTYTIAHSEASFGWGGQEIRIFQEMLAMRSRGHRVLLLAPLESMIAANCAAEQLEVIPLNTNKLRYPLTILQVAGELRRKKVEIVNTHSSRDGWLVGVAAKLAGARLLIRSRHIDVDYPNRLVSGIAFGKLPNLTFTTSEKIRKKLIDELKVDPARVHSIPTGIDLQRYSPDLPGTLRSELGLAAEVPLIGVIAVLRSWKGHLDFLQAIALLKTSNPELRVVFAGEGPMRDRIEKKRDELGLSETVTLLGHRSDIPEVLASVDIVVLPSYAHEGIPQVLLQAQAMRKPVIGTEAGGIPEIVEHEKTGPIVPASDPEAMAQAIRRLLTNPGEARQFGINARARVAANHGIESMCEKLEAIYKT